MKRLIAIGDIHGRLYKLEKILDLIDPQQGDTLVFLGDYIDRGPDSYEVVELLIDLKNKFSNTITLRGNHEDFVISIFMGNQNKAERNIWLKINGGELTMASYRGAGFYLKEHMDFYMNLPVCWETDRYFFCHAGAKRGRPLHEQKAYDLVDHRGPYPHPDEDLGKIVVHGHDNVEKPVILPNRINIDTGAGKHGSLTAIELPSLELWQV